MLSSYRGQNLRQNNIDIFYVIPSDKCILSMLGFPT